MLDFDVFDILFKNWDRPVKEVSGYRWLDTDNGKVLILNALGISKENLKVELAQQTLSVNGKTELKEFDITNSVNYKFNIQRSFVERLKEIKYEVKDGLVFIEFAIKPDKKNNIKISYKE